MIMDLLSSQTNSHRVSLELKGVESIDLFLVAEESPLLNSSTLAYA